MPRSRSLLFVLLFATAMTSVGCASAGKYYDRAAEAEASGNDIGAAEDYLRALDKEPAFRDARARLAVVGERAVAALWQQATVLNDTDAFDAALRVIDRIRSLIGRSAGFDVVLAPPEGMDDFRSTVTDRATDEAFNEAAGATADRRWSTALSVYERMSDRYGLSPAEQNRVRIGRVDVYLGWALQALEDGAFRLAHEKAGNALEFSEFDSPPGREARGILAAALSRGTRSVAVTPLWQTEAWRRSAPDMLRLDVIEAIAVGASTPLPLFIAEIPPAQVRRTLRQQGYDREALTRNLALRVAERLGADFVAAGELTSFTRIEELQSAETIRARTRGRGAVDTTFVRRRVEITIEATIAYRVVDAYGSDVVAAAEFGISSSGTFDRGAFAGNPDHLDLDGNERRLFDRQEWLEQDYELERLLVDRAAAQLRGRIFDAALSRIY